MTFLHCCKKFVSFGAEARKNYMHFVPSKIFLTKGVGTHKHELRSFELALRDAGIEKCNLVTVSSILPPRCKIISRKQGEQLLQPGQITFAVIARISTNEPHRLIAASIGVAAVVVLTALGDGARRYVMNEFSSLGSNLVIVLPGRSQTGGFSPGTSSFWRPWAAWPWLSTCRLGRPSWWK